MYLPIRLNFKPILLFLALGTLCRGIGTDFLSIPVSVEEMALRPNPVLGTRTGSNPALFHISSDPPILTISSGSWLAGTQATHLGYEWGRHHWTTGTHLYYVGLEGVELRTNRPTDEAIANYGAYGLTGEQVAAFDKAGYRLGLSIKWIWMQIYDQASVGGAVDMGVLKQLTPRIRLGISLLNLGRVSSFQSQTPTLPVRFLVGGSYQFDAGAIRNNLAVSTEWSSHVSGTIVRVSNEIQWRQVRILLGSQTSSHVSIISAGVKIHTGRFDIGYAFQAGSQGLGLPQYFELSTRLP